MLQRPTPRFKVKQHQRGHRHIRKPSRHSPGQVMILLALLLPVIVGFLVLSIAASLELNTKAQLDQAALTATIGASSDACMTSQYSFDLYECKGAPAADYAWVGGGTLPQPPFQSFGFPAWAPKNISCTPPIPPSSPSCVELEWKAAYDSANTTVRSILKADYPGFTVTDCVASPPCTYPNNNTSIVYQVTVSYAYYLDTDDPPASPPTNTNDILGKDAIPLDGSAPVCNLYGNTNPGQDAPCGAAEGDDLPPPPPAGHGYQIGGTGPDTAPPDLKPSNLVCPSTGKFGRQVTVQLWTKFVNPVPNLFGVRSLGLTSKLSAFGCGGT